MISSILFGVGFFVVGLIVGCYAWSKAMQRLDTVFWDE